MGLGLEPRFAGLFRAPSECIKIVAREMINVGPDAALADRMNRS